MGFYVRTRVPGTMASTLAAIYTLAFPAVGTIVAIAMTLFAWTIAKGRERGMSFDPRLPTMRLVLLVLPITLILFGFGLFLLISAASDNTAAAILEVSGFAFGASALAVGFAEAVIFWYGVAGLQKDISSFSRTIVLAVVPEMGALLAFAIAFLILQGARNH